MLLNVDTFGINGKLIQIITSLFLNGLRRKKQVCRPLTGMNSLLLRQSLLGLFMLLQLFLKSNNRLAVGNFVFYFLQILIYYQELHQSAL